MNTGQLETFIQVAENLNFARAAESLNITTSAVSRQIRCLEEELDTKLLNRTTKSVSLTPSGVIFYNDAKEILARLELTRQKLDHETSAHIKMISIGYTDEADPALMVPLLQQCKAQLPELHPFLHIIPARLLLNMLINDEIDILFGFKDDVLMRENLVYHELAQVPVCCVLPSGHPLAQKDELSEQELLTETIVVCNSHEMPSRVANVQNQLSSKFSPTSIYYSENLQAMLTLIKAGYGIGLFPEMPSDAELVYIPLKEDYSLSYGIYYKNSSKSTVLKEFLSLLKIQ